MADGVVRTAANALRLDWARDLRWAVAGDPWSVAPAAARSALAGSAVPEPALPGLTRARVEVRAAVPELRSSGPMVLGVLEDAPLLGTLGNLQTAAGALALGREMRAALGRSVPVVLVLLGGPDPRPRPLYALGRDGEVRRVAAARRAADGEQARQGALQLLGSLEAITARPWPEARCALDAAAMESRADLWSRWSVRLWRHVAGPLGAVVLHGALPPLGDALSALAPALASTQAALGGAVASAARRLAEAGLRSPEGPDAAFEMWRRAENGWYPAPAPGQDRPRWPGWWAARDGRDGACWPGRVGALLLCHALLSPAALVAGDDDVGRLVLLSLAIQRLDGAPPAIRPRPRWTLVAPAETAFARANAAPLDQGPAALRLARDRAFARGAGGQLDEELQALRGLMADRLERVGREVASCVPRASGVVHSRSERLMHGVDLLVAEVCTRRRAEDRTQARAWRHLISALYPFGGHQDEWLAAYPWAAGAGGALLERLAAEVPGPARRWLRWPEPAKGPIEPEPLTVALRTGSEAVAAPAAVGGAWRLHSPR